MADKREERIIDIRTNADQVRQQLVQLLSIIDKTSTEFKTLQKQISDLDQATEKYDKTVKDLNQDIGHTASAVKIMEKNHKDAEKTLSKATTESQKLGKSLSGTAKASDDLRDSVGGVSGAFEKFKSGDFAGGFKDVTEGIKGATKAALAFIATPIGATIAAITAIAAGTKALWDYNTAMAESAKITKQFTGLAGEELEAVDIKVQGIMQRTGADQREILQATQALVTQFGISYDEAFEKINLGYQRAGASAEDFFDNTAEYSTFLANAGYNADEFFAIMEAGAQNGVYKDKILDSLKEIDLRLTEMPKSASDALTAAFGDQFSNELQKGLRTGEMNTKQALDRIGKEADKVGLSIVEKQTLVADVFGAAGEDAGGFVAVLDSVSQGIDRVGQGLTEMEQSQQDMTNAQDDMNQAFADLFNSTDGGFTIMKNQLMTGVYEGIAAVVNGVREAYNWFVDLYNESSAFAGTMNTIGAIGKFVWDSFKTGIQNAVVGIKGLAKLVEAVFKGDFGSISGIWSDTLNEMSENTAKMTKNTADNFVNAWDGKNKKLKRLEENNAKDIQATNKKTTDMIIRDSNRATENSKKNAKKVADEYKKQLEALGKLFEQLNNNTVLGKLSSNINKSIKDIEDLNKVVDKFIKLINKPNPTKDETAFINTFLSGSITKTVNDSVKSYNLIGKTIEDLQGKMAKLSSDARSYLKFDGADSEQYKQAIDTLAIYESQMNVLLNSQRELQTNLKTFKEFQKLQQATNVLEGDSQRSGKQLGETLISEYEQVLNGEKTKMSTKLTEITGFKQFADNVKNISKDAWDYFIASQPKNLGDALKLMYDEFISDQEKLNDLTKKYKEEWEEIQKEIKPIEIKFQTPPQTELEKVMGIYRAVSRDDMKDSLNTQKKTNIDQVNTNETNELDKVKGDLEAENAIRAKYAKQRVDIEKEASDAEKQIDDISNSNREEALAHTANILSDGAALFGEHTVMYKAMAIAATTIDTYQSAMASYRGMIATIPGPVGIAAGAVAAAASVAMGIKQISEIAKVKVDGASDTSSASIPNMAQAPNVSFVSSGSNQIAETIVSSENSSDPLQVEVKVTDINNAQASQAKVKQNSSL